jgi:GDP-4-dehydro-6-deoxy-D-mannose reductase
VSKYLSEQVALQYYRNYGSQILIARPFNHTGPGQPAGFVVPDFCRQIAEIESLAPEEQEAAELSFGPLSPVRDFLDVRDVVRGYEAIAVKGQVAQCYNICSGLGLSIAQVLQRILSASRLKDQLEIQCDAACSGTEDRHIGSSKKVQTITDWKVRYPFEQTLRATLSDWRQKLQDPEPSHG